MHVPAFSNHLKFTCVVNIFLITFTDLYIAPEQIEIFRLVFNLKRKAIKKKIIEIEQYRIENSFRILIIYIINNYMVLTCNIH